VGNDLITDTIFQFGLLKRHFIFWELKTADLEKKRRLEGKILRLAQKFAFFWSFSHLPISEHHPAFGKIFIVVLLFYLRGKRFNILTERERSQPWLS